MRLLNRYSIAMLVWQGFRFQGKRMKEYCSCINNLAIVEKLISSTFNAVKNSRLNKDINCFGIKKGNYKWVKSNGRGKRIKR